jgi:hypothetical protein
MPFKLYLSLLTLYLKTIEYGHINHEITILLKKKTPTLFRVDVFDCSFRKWCSQLPEARHPREGLRRKMPGRRLDRKHYARH